MKPKEFYLACGTLIAICCLFFYKTILHGSIPFPGDLLVSEYKPWSTYSYLGYNPGSYPQKAQYFDTIRQLYPWKTLSIDEIKHTVVPLWNPYNFAGSPLLANNQSAVLYPLNVLYLLLSQPWAWTILVILQPLLASIFTYLYCKSIKLSSLGSIVASVSYGYCLYMSVFLEYNSIGQVALWLPLLIFAIERLLIKQSSWAICIFVFGLVCAGLSGHLQLFVTVLVFVFIYTLLRNFYVEDKEKGKKGSILVFSLLCISLGILAIQLLPTLELIVHSARASQPYIYLVEQLLIAPSQLILYLVPDFYGNPATRSYLLSDSYPGNALYIGLIPFFFAIYALLSKKKTHPIHVLSLLCILFLLLTVRSPISEFVYRLNIPLLSTSSPSNMIFVVSFCLAVLGGWGFDTWLITPTKRKRKLAVVLIYMTIIALAVPSVISHNFSFKNLLYSSGLSMLFGVCLLAIKVKPSIQRIIQVILIVIIVLDLFYFFQKFNPFVTRELVFPKAPILSWLKQNSAYERFWGYGSASIEANFATQHQLFSPDGYDPLYSKRYGEFITSSKEGKIPFQFTNQTRSDAIVAPGYGKIDLSTNVYRKKVLDTLGVAYVLDRAENNSTEETFTPLQYQKIHEESGWLVYKNLHAAPRVFLTSDYKVYKTTQEFEKLFFDSSFDPGKTILLEEPIQIQNSNNPGSAIISTYKPTNVTIQTKSDDSKLLFLSDTYYPGWKAFIDSVPTKIYRADYAFRAVVVPKGIHSVTFEYSPLSFSYGLKVSIISIGVLLVLMVYVKKHNS